MFTDDIAYLVGHPVEPLTEARESVPRHWQGYLDPDPTRRLAATGADIGILAKHLPKAHAALSARLRDVFVVAENDSFLRVLNKKMDDGDDLYSYFSNAPLAGLSDYGRNRLFLDHAPRAFGDLYEKWFDGLFDASQAGILPLRGMTPLAGMIDDFIDYPWYPELKSQSRLEDVVLIFSSGGGGYLFLDLRIDQSATSDPTCMLIIADRQEPLETALPFWEYLDVWTSIALGD